MEGRRVYVFGLTSLWSEFGQFMASTISFTHDDFLFLKCKWPLQFSFLSCVLGSFCHRPSKFINLHSHPYGVLHLLLNDLPTADGAAFCDELRANDECPVDIGMRGVRSTHSSESVRVLYVNNGSDDGDEGFDV